MKKTIHTVLPYVTAYNAEHYNAQTPMTKKEFLKIKGIVWIEVRWRDAPNQALLLIEKPKREPGDICFTAIGFSEKYNRIVRHNLVNDQVVRVIGTLQVPKL